MRRFVPGLKAIFKEILDAVPISIGLKIAILIFYAIFEKSVDLDSISMSISILEKKTTSYHASRVRTAVVAFRTAPTLVSEGKLLAFRAVYSLQSCKGYTKHIYSN